MYKREINYQLMDLSDEEHLGMMGREQFDAAVCNMALMDMATITPASASPADLILQPEIPFVMESPANGNRRSTVCLN